MKKIIGFIGSNFLYWLGNLIFKLTKHIHIFWNMYQKLMITSIRIQDWAKLDKPWGRPENKM